ncbi:MAG: leucyl aminopeptidase family protein [Proteobacteria bacterium]|nr:leucyl aminopeptidase family protein [Pseudomonadota bacterium]
METRIRFLTREEAGDIRDFQGDRSEVTVRYQDGETLILCGLGQGSDSGPRAILGAAAAGVRKALELKRTGICLDLSGKAGGGGDVAGVEGAWLGAYSFERYKGEPGPQMETVQVVGAESSRKKLEKAATLCECVWYARDLVNENAEEVTPQRLAAEAEALGQKDPSLAVEVLDEDRIRDEGLGLLFAVGKGSVHPPRLAMAQYLGAPRRKERILLVGKGITFDSGGQNLKSSGSIEDMRTDMAGAATVLGIMRALSILRPTVNVAGVVVAAHNAMDARSYFPGDVYRSGLGKSVEIGNTDAEGRLVLADALAWGIRRFSPTRVVDVATLTGGILVALGTAAAGLFSNDDTLAGELYEAGESTRERLWRLPLYPEYTEAMKSDRADLRNIAKYPRGHASSVTGAAFLQEFVQGLPWAHLDIAGTAYNGESPRGEVGRFATGFGVRLLARFLGVY